MKEIILKTIEKGISYSDYREMVEDFADRGTTSGIEKSEVMISTTVLNRQRMKRLDKTLKVEEDKKEVLKGAKKQTWVVISEAWCADAAQILPVLNKMVQESENIELKVVYRDENEEFMNMFLTNGGKAIPMLIIVEEGASEVQVWGPRPKVATEMVRDFKEKNGSLTAEFKEDLQKWYNGDKGKEIVREVCELIGK